MNIRTVSLPMLSVILTASLLCGCNGEPTGSNSETGSQSGTSSVSEPAESIDNTPSIPGDATFLKGALGETIYTSEITNAVDGEGNAVAPEALSKESFTSASIDSAYCALPLYPCVTDRDGEYDETNMIFKNVPQERKSDYIKVKAGDTVCGLKVTYAISEFNINAEILGCVVGTSLELEGEITLTGYAWIEPADDYGIVEGDIRFVPSGDVQLPVVRFDNTDENGIPNRQTGEIYYTNGITHTNEFSSSLDLGNIADTTADISDLETDGTPSKVTITVSNIKMSSTLDWLTRFSAELVSVKAA